MVSLVFFDILQLPHTVISNSEKLTHPTQQPQADSLCVRPPVTHISQQPVGVAQQPQAASLYARPPAADMDQPLAPTPFSQAQVAAEFPRVLTTSKKLPAVCHKVQHIIETTCRRPISSWYHRLDPEKLEAVKKEFADIEAQGIMRRSNSSWPSPLHIVEKSDGMWWTCGDYHLLNLATKPDLYPPPHMEDLSARLAGMTVFSKLDLRKGYYQVLVAASDVQKTAVITPFGLFKFKRMPFELRNASQSFQRFMDQMLGGIPHSLCT